MFPMRRVRWTRRDNRTFGGMLSLLAYVKSANAELTNLL